MTSNQSDSVGRTLSGDYGQREDAVSEPKQTILNLYYLTGNLTPKTLIFMIRKLLKISSKNRSILCLNAI